MKPAELVGSKFGRLTVIVRDGSNPRREAMWRCHCHCGNAARVSTRNLRRGSIVSCGCVRRPHGMCGTPVWRAWKSMRQRCLNPANSMFVLYGGRGITVCDRWKDSFESFLLDVGERPGPEYSIDRINNDGNYEPGNVRWATAKEQQQNTRRTLKVSRKRQEIIARSRAGESRVGIARDLGIDPSTVSRIATGDRQ